MHEPHDIGQGVVPGWALELRGAATDDVELALEWPFLMGYLPEDLALGLDVRLLSGEFELALRATGRLLGPAISAPGGYLSLRGCGRLAGVLRVEGSVGFGVLAWQNHGQRSPEPTHVGLIQPAAVASTWWPPATTPGLGLAATVSPVDYLHLGLETGFGMHDVSVPSSSFVPLGLRAGVALPSDDAPATDLDLRFTLPYLLMPAAGDEPWLPAHGDGPFVPSWWWLTLGVRGFVYL